MRRLLLGLILACGSLVWASTPLPTVITDNSSAMVLYFNGRMSAQEQVQGRDPAGYGPTLRSIGESNRGQGYYWLSTSPHFAAFLFGRADAFDEAADAAGEPLFGN